jgi:hypothetical protein
MSEIINGNPIFIGGLMKSGTSLLRKLLGLHSNIYGGLETHWFSEDFVNHWETGASKRHDWLLDFFEVSKTEADEIRQASNSAFDYFNRFMNYCTVRTAKKRWVEKTPDNVFHIETILKQWPNARVLIMHRDYKDIYASWKKNKKRTFDIFLETAKKYQDALDQWKDNEQVTVISYNDLVHSPKKSLQEVLEFISEQYIDGLENYRGDATDYDKVLEVTGVVSHTAISLQKPIFTSSVNQWKSILDENEIQIIQNSLEGNI